jgi:hypothetical protein
MTAATLPSHSLMGQRLIDLTQRPDAAIRESFTSVAGVRALPGNRAVVTDQMERALFLADFTSAKLTPIGRQGEGPAEYRFPMAPLPGPSNSTYVLDASLERVLVVSPAGAIVSDVSLQRAGVPAGAEARGTDQRGRIYFEVNSFDPERGTFSDTVAILRWNPRNNRVDTLGRTWSGGRVIVKGPTGNASLARSITPYPALDVWAVFPDGRIAIVHHQPFDIDVVDTVGRVRRGSPRTDTPLPVTAADREAFRAQMSLARSGAMMRGGGIGPQRSATAVPDAEFPRMMPPFVASSVIMSPNGELWVGRSHAAGDHVWYYDIVDASGRTVAIAKIAADSKVVGFGPGRVYVARKDPADDLVYLERYRR